MRGPIISAPKDVESRM